MSRPSDRAAGTGDPHLLEAPHQGIRLAGTARTGYGAPDRAAAAASPADRQPGQPRPLPAAKSHRGLQLVFDSRANAGSSNA